MQSNPEPAMHACPFCGGGNTEPLPVGLISIFEVTCLRCYARGPKAGTRVDAILLWNSRQRWPFEVALQVPRG